MSGLGFHTKLRRLAARRRTAAQIARMERFLSGVGRITHQSSGPVLFFNASSRLGHLSQNAAFGLIASWAVRSQGVPVVHLVCREGMDQCVLGSDRNKLESNPPCQECMAMSERIFPEAMVQPLLRNEGVFAEAMDRVEGLSLPELAEWEFAGFPLGEICLPSLRWALRRHNLPDQAPIRQLFRRYLASAASLSQELQDSFQRRSPRALVVFNGITYPEATARTVAMRQGIRVITHEVGLRPLSAFFSHEHATFRQVELPADFELAPGKEQELDLYLQARASGRFTMAGVRFWPEMQSLAPALIERIAAFRQMILVFTNVIFDTSQIHANRLYPHMFAWLEDIREAIERHPESLFVIRAHPDEDREGKRSEESVAGWIREQELESIPNVVFVSPKELLSSYELIRKAKFVMVYNSSIGLEASIMGAAVLSAGRARYTQIPTVFYPSDRAAYRADLERFLEADQIEVPPQFQANARKFLAYELYQASLSFSGFLEDYPLTPGVVSLASFEPERLLALQEAKLVARGILEGTPFELPA